MSIINQARLTLLSHKCMSMAASRYENGFIQRNHHTYSTLPRPKQSPVNLPYGEPSANRPNEVTDKWMEARIPSLNDTPKPYCQRRNPVLDRILVKELINNANHNNLTLLIVKDTTPPLHPFDKFTSSWSKLKNRTNRSASNYLFYDERGHSFVVQRQPKPPLTNAPFNTQTVHNAIFRLRNYSHSDNRHENHNSDFKGAPHFRTSIFPMLSLLGLYKGMNASDIEEEKAKLTDEQKMKKMTPGELFIARGVLSMCDQDYTKANELFHKALHYAQDHNDENQETLVLNLLASNYFESGDLENAEKLFIDLMKRMISHDVEPTDPAILELSLKLASIYSKNYRTQDKAMKGFKFVISTSLNNLKDLLDSDGDIREISEDRKDEIALLGWSYDWFAKHLIAIGDYGGAVLLLHKALKISSQVLGPIHDQTLILMNDVGTTMAMNNSPEEGKQFMKKAVEGAIESQSKELASFYVNLGLVNLNLKQLDEAKKYCEYSIELASKNPDHHNSSEVIRLSRICLNEMERLSGGR